MDRFYTFRYRLEPSAEQERRLWSYAGTCRFVHNAALEHNTVCYRQWQARGSVSQDKPTVRWQDWSDDLPVSRGPNKIAADDPLAWLVDTPKRFLQQTLIDLARAFDNFFDERADHPAPHKKWRNDSFRIPEAKSVRFDSGHQKHVGLPKLGWMRLSLSKRSLRSYHVGLNRPWRGTLKNATGHAIGPGRNGGSGHSTVKRQTGEQTQRTKRRRS